MAGRFEFTQRQRGTQRTPQHQFRQSHHGGTGKYEQGSSAQITQHVHEHRGHRFFIGGKLRRQIFHAGDADVGHLDHDRVARHLRQRRCGVPCADIRRFPAARPTGST
jgi:hypothetical protein